MAFTSGELVFATGDRTTESKSAADALVALGFTGVNTGTLIRDGATSYQVRTDNHAASAAPGASDDSTAGYGVGSDWTDTVAQDTYVCVDATAAAAVWVQTNGGGGGAVSSVFGRTGAVVAAASDYDASQVDNDSGVTGAFVKDALDTLDSGKAAASHSHAAGDITSGTFADALVAASNVTQHVAAIDHDSLLNFDGNEHVDHTVVTIGTASSTSGLSGGGTIAATRALVVDIAGTTAGTIATGDLILMADIDDTNALKRVTAQSIADLATDAVSSVFGRTGAVVAAASDYDASEVDNDSGVVGAFVKDALDTLDSGKAAASHSHAAGDITSGTFADALVAASNVTQHAAAIDHDSLLNFDGNEHVDHTVVTIGTASSTSGLSGGGTIAATRALVVDIAGTTAGTVAAGDLLLMADIDDTNALKRVTAQSIADLGGGATIDDTAGVGATTSAWSADRLIDRTIDTNRDDLAPADDGRPIAVTSVTADMLLHFNGNFTDATGNHTPAAQNGATTAASPAKFGSHSLFLDGTDDWVKVPAHANWNLGAAGSGDFTVSLWVYFNGLPDNTSQGWLCATTGGTDGYQFMHTRQSGVDQFQLWDQAGGVQRENFNSNFSISGWHHIAFGRRGGQFAVWRDGIYQTASASLVDTDMDNDSAPLAIGASSTAGTEVADANFDELRWVKGTCVYPIGGNFTPPDREHTVTMTLYTAGTAISVDSITEFQSGNGVNLEGMQFKDTFLTTPAIAAPAVSASGEGRLYFDSSSNTFQVSENGGAYVELTSISAAPLSNLTAATAGNSISNGVNAQSWDWGGTLPTHGLRLRHVASGGGQTGNLLELDTVNVGSDVFPLYVSARGTFIFSTNNNATPQILGALGAEANPIYSFSGDDNTGVFSPTGDTWAVSTGGTERLRITSTGGYAFGVVGAPDNFFHVHRGSAGSVTSLGSTVATFEHSGSMALTLLCPTANSQAIYFGDPTNGSTDGRIIHSPTGRWITIGAGGTNGIAVDNVRNFFIGGGNTNAANATNTVHILSGTAPTGGVADNFLMYSDDIVAGNAAPHFRTEDGSIVKLFTSAAYTRNAAVVEDRTLLASASATTLNNNNVLAALIADLQATGLLA